MMKVNIGGDKNDPFYRYKRDVIQIEFNTKKGGTTTILNMDTICKQLNAPSEFKKSFYKKYKEIYFFLIK